ncbi:MAG: hypothetical protein FWG91_03090 [Lachnospiraceae bacterium]|nr:hypothetical protein [Lachnospiraceae bacterium]
MTIDNWLTMISLILVVGGGIFAGFQWHITNRIKRAEFINAIIIELRFNKEMAKTMYRIDYLEDSWYDEDFHNSHSDLEFEIDKLLSYLSYICYLKYTRNISNKEFKFLQYEIVRACSSPDVQSYLWNLFHFSKACSSKCSFEYLVLFGINNKLFHRSFSSKESGFYDKRLNF